MEGACAGAGDTYTYDHGAERSAAW